MTQCVTGRVITGLPFSDFVGVENLHSPRVSFPYQASTAEWTCVVCSLPGGMAFFTQHVSVDANLRQTFVPIVEITLDVIAFAPRPVPQRVKHTFVFGWIRSPMHTDSTLKSGRAKFEHLTRLARLAASSYKRHILYINTTIAWSKKCILGDEAEFRQQPGQVTVFYFGRPVTATGPAHAVLFRA